MTKHIFCSPFGKRICLAINTQKYKYCKIRIFSIFSSDRTRTCDLLVTTSIIMSRP